jgi:hypothetical protein
MAASSIVSHNGSIENVAISSQTKKKMANGGGIGGIANIRQARPKA